MADIKNISVPSGLGDATDSEVLEGATYTSDNGIKRTGTFAPTAENISYDGTESGIDAETVQQAIDIIKIFLSTVESEAKSYTDTATAGVKNDLLNGAGAAYDTLQELGDLIDDNQDAIEALETVATGKADKVHSHKAGDITSGTLASDRLPTVPLSKGGTGATTAEAARTNLGAAADTHSHKAGDITTGILPMARGGTGTSADIVNAPNNALLKRLKTDTYDQLYYEPTNAGALYATAENGDPKFGTLPIAQGGTGATNIDDAIKKLLTKNTNTVPTEDTPTAWEAMGLCIIYFNSSSTVINKPTTYGTLINIPYSSKVHQIWLRQGYGYVWTRGGTATGWNGNADVTGADAWRRLYDSNSVIPLKNGGTGIDFSNVKPYALIRATSDLEAYPYLYSTPTNNGAFYATAENGEGKFGTLPIAQGGTGATTVPKLISNLCEGNNNNADPEYVLGFDGNYANSGWTTIKQLRNTMGLGNTTGALPIENGGTGATTAADALSNLGGLSKSAGGAVEGFISAKGGSGMGTTASSSGLGVLDNTADGWFYSTSANGVGILKIQLPTDFNGAMICFDVEIYSHNRQAILTYSFGGQIYKNNSTGAYSWSYRAYSIDGASGNSAFTNLQICFGRHGEKAAVSIGVADTEWGYVNCVIKNFRVMYNAYGHNNWNDGWVITLDANPMDEVLNTHDNPIDRVRQNLGFKYGATVPTTAPTSGAGSVFFQTGGDAVVEVGTSGMWTYRKWASGIAECWAGNFTDTWTYDGGLMGGFLYKKSYDLPSGLFIEPVTGSMNGHLGSGVGWAEMRVGGTGYIDCYICGNTDSSTATIQGLFVKGRWK